MTNFAAPEEVPSWRRKVRRVSTGINWVIGAAIVVMLAVIVLVISLQIVMRGLIGSSLVWTSELSGVLLVWSVCLGIALAFRTRSHINVDVLTNILPSRLRVSAQWVGDALSLLFLVLLTGAGIQVATLAMAQITPALRLPMGFVYLAIPIGGALAILNIVTTILDPVQKATVDDLEMEL